ncbi:MAG TPA: hypothetical protein VIG80_16300 [Bacillaceae bacterium]
MTVNREAIEHGIPVNAAESRTAAICISKEGKERLVIAAKGFVLVVDPDTEKTKQLFFPEKNKEYPFASFSSEDGLFYTGAGNMLMAIDPFQEVILDYQRIDNGEEIVGFSFAEDASGQIYFTSYPGCHLLQYCLKTKTILDHGSMDATEKYPASVALDRHGWVYIGVGTERKNMIAYHPETREKKSLVPQNERTRGAGYVYKGVDGSVYGSWEAGDLKDVHDSSKWHIFLDGNRTPAAGHSPSLYTGQGFSRIHRNGQGTHRVLELNLPEGYIVIEKQLGKPKRIALPYESEGAALSTLVAANDQYIYGTSMHPLHLFRFDLGSKESKDFGGSVIEKGGGGNIAAYAVQGSKMIGFAYAGGKVYELDLQQEIHLSENSRNPNLIKEEKEHIHRPRCAVSHTDGVHIIWGGFPGYGMAGGGLGIYDVEARTNTVIPHSSIVPNQSTVALGILSSGDILGGTSIETPGGASTDELEGKLYVFDWAKKKLAFVISPIQGSREISQIFVDSRDMAHGLTAEGTYFVFDPSTREVVYKKDISEYGSPVRNAFALSEDQSALYCLLSKAVFKIDMSGDRNAEPHLFAELKENATSGVVLHKGNLYYGSGSRLMSVKVDGE